MEWNSSATKDLLFVSTWVNMSFSQHTSGGEAYLNPRISGWNLKYKMFCVYSFKSLWFEVWIQGRWQKMRIKRLHGFGNESMLKNVSVIVAYSFQSWWIKNVDPNPVLQRSIKWTWVFLKDSEANTLVHQLNSVVWTDDLSCRRWLPTQNGWWVRAIEPAGAPAWWCGCSPCDHIFSMESNQGVKMIDSEWTTLATSDVISSKKKHWITVIVIMCLLHWNVNVLVDHIRVKHGVKLWFSAPTAKRKETLSSKVLDLTHVGMVSGPRLLDLPEGAMTFWSWKPQCYYKYWLLDVPVRLHILTY